MKKSLLTIAVLVSIFVAGLFYYSFVMSNNTGRNENENRAIGIALQNVGLTEPSWQSIVLCASREVKIPRQTVWETWSRLENWNKWSSKLIQSTKWIDTPGWREGAKFEQVLELGFPLGAIASQESVQTFVPELIVGWQKRKDDFISSHIWLFEDLPDGKTLIVNTEIYHGSLVWLIKPFVVSQWQEKFESSVEGLVSEAKKHTTSNNYE